MTVALSSKSFPCVANPSGRVCLARLTFNGLDCLVRISSLCIMQAEAKLNGTKSDSCQLNPSLGGLCGNSRKGENC